jgi:hypothetical protein
MNHSFQPDRHLTRRRFLQTSLGTAGTVALLQLLSTATPGAAVKLWADAQQQHQPGNPLSAWQVLREAEDADIQFILRHSLVPLFGLPPVARQQIASTTRLNFRTWRDRFYPPSVVTSATLDATEQEEIRNHMPGDQFGHWDEKGLFRPFTPAELSVELEIAGKRVFAAPIMHVAGPCTLDRLFFVQQHPWYPPYQLEHVEVLLQVDGSWYSCEGNDFFEHWYPFAIHSRSADGNNCSLPIGAKQQLSLYLRSTAERYSRYEKRYITSLSGWFAALFSRYAPAVAEDITPFTAQTVPVYTAATAAVKAAIEELGYRSQFEPAPATAFELLARKLYGAQHCTTRTLSVTLQPAETLDIPVTAVAVPVGLRLAIPKASLGMLDRVIIWFTYPDGYRIILPVRYLFGSLIENPIHIAPPNERPHLYETLYTGLKTLDDKILLYANIPLIGLAGFSLQTLGDEPILLQLEYDSVPKAVLPQSLTDKKFVPYFSEIVSNGHDHILAPPTSTPGIVVGTYLFEADWHHRADAESPIPFKVRAGGKPSNWKFFFLEYNPTLLRFGIEPSGHLSTHYVGAIPGWEDLISSFYAGGAKDNAKASRNMRKGSPIHGRFLAARFHGEKKEFEGGLCSFMPVHLTDQAFVLPLYGYNRVDAAPLITQCRLRTLTFCYVGEAEELTWSLAGLYDQLGWQEQATELPLAQLSDLRVRYNLKRMVQRQRAKWTPADQTYLEQARQFYRQISAEFANERQANPTLQYTHRLRQGIQTLYQQIFEAKHQR